jgi:hypothetical protein
MSPEQVNNSIREIYLDLELYPPILHPVSYHSVADRMNGNRLRIDG